MNFLFYNIKSAKQKCQNLERLFKLYQIHQGFKDLKISYQRKM